MSAIEVASPIEQCMLHDGCSRAFQEICDGLSTVRSTLRVVQDFEPERIFFILPANLTILSTLGLGLLAIASIISDQVLQRVHDCFALAFSVFCPCHSLFTSAEQRQRLSHRRRPSGLCSTHHKQF